jgi:hypothetical protein
MPKQSLPLDPFDLSRVGMATWMTSVMVGMKFAQAFSEQNALMTRAMGGPPARPAPPDLTVL